jgi:hypothetical protein
MATDDNGNLDGNVVCTNLSTGVLCSNGTWCAVEQNDEWTVHPVYEFSDEWSVSATCFSAASLVVSVVAMGMLIRRRKEPVLQLSQWELLLMVPLFTFSINLGWLLQSVNYLFPLMHSVACKLYFFFFYVGAYGLFLSLGLKTFRAWRLRRCSQKLKPLDVSGRSLWISLAVVLAIVIVLLAVWLLAFPLDSHLCAANGAGCFPSLTFNGGNAGADINWVLEAGLLALMLATCVIAVVAHNVPSVAGESLGITISVITFFCGAFVLTTVLYVTTGVHDTSEQMDTTRLTFAATLYFFLWTVLSHTILVFYKFRFVGRTADELRSLFLASLATRSKASGAANAATTTTASTHSSDSSAASETPTSTSTDNSTQPPDDARATSKAEHVVLVTA